MATLSESGAGPGRAGGGGNAVGYFPCRFPVPGWVLGLCREPGRVLWTLPAWTGPEEEVAFLQNSLFLLIVGADSSRYPRLLLKCHAMQGFPALFTAPVVYAYISTNTVKCLLSRRILTINVCVYVCVSILTAFLGSGVLFYCSEDTLLYNVYIF